ncbi:WXG100 family type VII secretion target [Streptomyces sp. NPDC053048]|uniref:WXG100 family type VII secretion target n=1 Tax=Streptomyces sp. NPDC053048 TaxID=3365694 RepID=UPI0037D0ED51
MSGNDVDLKVSYAHVSELAAAIDQAAGVVQKNLDDIWAAVRTISGSWTGEAREMFNAADTQFHARGNHIHATLTKVAETIRTGSSHYAETDRKASRLFDISY